MNLEQLRKEFKAKFGHDAPDSLTKEQIESILKAASSEKETKIAQFDTKSIDEKEMTVDIIISSENRDRYGDIVLQDGIDFANFEGNPVIPFAHNYWEPPVAKAVKWWKTTGKKGKVTKMKLKFMDFDEFSTKIFKMIKEGFLNASSIGFIPKKWRDEKDEAGVWTRFYTQTELLEVSIVPVPANPDALSLAVEKGILAKGEVSSFSEKLHFAQKSFVKKDGPETEDDDEHDEDDEQENKDLDARILSLKEKGIDEKRMFQLFFEYHDSIKAYRSFVEKVRHLLGVEAEDDEKKTIEKTSIVLLDMISESSQDDDDDDESGDPTANPSDPTKSEARTAPMLTGNALAGVIERALAKTK